MKVSNARRRFSLLGVGLIATVMAGPTRLVASEPASRQPLVINVADYGVQPGDKDCTRALREALVSCRAKGVKRLIFPKGQYHFFPDQAEEAYLFVSNNDEGLRRMAFPLHGIEDLSATV